MKKHSIILLTGLLLLILVSTVSAETEIEAFTEVGEHTWNVPDNVDEVDVLIVGGGGGGAARHGGGGGAGGLLFLENYSLERDTISIEVGAGGPRTLNPSGTGDSRPGYDGENSSFEEVSVAGGGGGGAYNADEPGRDGGSGGGGAGDYGDRIGSGIEGQGNDGGYGMENEPYNHGGGGGAHEPGEDGVDGDGERFSGSTGGSPGDGGDGIYFGDIFGEEYGENGYFAGGGGGGSHDPEPDDWGYGGIGGGGDGGDKENVHGEDAIDNTGSGGGGGTRHNDGDLENDNTEGRGGAGGSGIVLVRYQSDLSICDRRGLSNECISNSTHEIDGESFELESVFESESTAVFEALNQKASITVSNSSIISGAWRGGFDIQSDRPRLEAGAEFRPEGERIVIGN